MGKGSGHNIRIGEDTRSVFPKDPSRPAVMVLIVDDGPAELRYGKVSVWSPKRQMWVETIDDLERAKEVMRALGRSDVKETVQ
jgi:hypothetical protein